MLRLSNDLYGGDYRQGDDFLGGVNGFRAAQKQEGFVLEFEEELK